MLPKPSSCKGCPLYGDGLGWVPPSGGGGNGVLLVGEAAGETEEKEGVPFVGQAGMFLNRMLKRAGLEREGFRIANVLSCRPPGNKLSGTYYETAAISHCSPNLDKVIEEMKPKAIVALGNIPLERLTGYSQVSRYRGFVLPGPKGSWVIPTFHPSFLLPRKGQPSQTKFVGTIIRDLKLAREIAQSGFKRLPTDYWLDPSPEAAQGFVEEYESTLDALPNTYLSWDIETPYKMAVGDEGNLAGADEEADEMGDEDGDEDSSGARRPRKGVVDPILRISFSFRPGHAMSIPWQPAWMKVIRRLLGSKGKKIGWNATIFDMPVVAGAGVQVNGVLYDMMWGFHYWQSHLPKGLEAAASLCTDLMPWKHEAYSQPAWYSAVDADAALRCGLYLEERMRAQGQWDVFERHVVKLDPILVKAGQVTGVHIDREAQDKLKFHLESEKARLITEAQPLVPDFLKPTKTYVRFQEGLTPIDVVVPTTICSACKKPGVSTKHKCPSGGEWKKEVVNLPAVHYSKTLDFNPNSRNQLMDYARHYKHPLGRDHKTKQPSLGKKDVARLVKMHGAKHPIYKISLSMRGITKTLGTYVNGFAPDEDGKIYTTYTHAPWTLRLSSRDKNLQNVSHRGNVAYAHEVRATIIPPPGRVFVEADSSAIEAVMTGYFMGSERFIKLAKQGVHAYLTCYEMKIPFTPENIKVAKAEKGGVLYAKNKQVVYLSLYGGTPKMMSATYPEYFPTYKVAQASQDLLFEACPELKEWQHQTRLFAHKNPLVNPWGYRFYFYDVFRKTLEKFELGDDGNKVVAVPAQSSAAAFQKDNALLIAGQVPEDWIPANFLIHDSYCLIPQEDKRSIKLATEILRSTLTRPIPEMAGLRIGCEIKLGRKNWADMETILIDPA